MLSDGIPSTDVNDLNIPKPPMMFGSQTHAAWLNNITCF